MLNKAGARCLARCFVSSVRQTNDAAACAGRVYRLLLSPLASKRSNTQTLAELINKNRTGKRFKKRTPMAGGYARIVCLRWWARPSGSEL